MMTGSTACLCHNCKDPQEDALHGIHLVPLQEKISTAVGTGNKSSKHQISCRAEVRSKHTVTCFMLKGYFGVLKNECLLVKNVRKPRIHHLEATTATT